MQRRAFNLIQSLLRVGGLALGSAEQFSAAVLTAGLSEAEVETLSIDVYSRHMSPYRGQKLFEWEAALLKELPDSPATIFIPAAGSGREARALIARGYDVVACEPTASGSRDLIAQLGECAFQASFDDLLEKPELVPEVDAVLVGWGSLSHCLGHSRRERLLKLFCERSRGPVMMSFFTRSVNVRPWRWAASLVPNMPRDRGFVRNGGYFELFSRTKLEATAASCGRTLVELRRDWPSVFLLSSS